MTKNKVGTFPSPRIRGIATFLWLPLVVLIAIFILTASGQNIYFPPANEVVETVIDGFTVGKLGDALAYSLFNFFSGYLVAAILGILLGLILGENPWVMSAVSPALNFTRALPYVALVPIFIIALGLGALPKIALIALGCIWPVMLNTVSGVQGIQPSIREVVRTYRIRRFLSFRRITFMGALPEIFTGLRIAISVGIVLVVVSEMYGSTDGIGHYILFSGQRFAIRETWAATIVLALVGYLLNMIFLGFEHISLGWYYRRPSSSKSGANQKTKSGSTVKEQN